MLVTQRLVRRNPARPAGRVAREDVGELGASQAGGAMLGSADNGPGGRRPRTRRVNADIPAARSATPNAGTLSMSARRSGRL